MHICGDRHGIRCGKLARGSAGAADAQLGFLLVVDPSHQLVAMPFRKQKRPGNDNTAPRAKKNKREQAQAAAQNAVENLKPLTATARANPVQPPGDPTPAPVNSIHGSLWPSEMRRSQQAAQRKVPAPLHSLSAAPIRHPYLLRTHRTNDPGQSNHSMLWFEV